MRVLLLDDNPQDAISGALTAAGHDVDVLTDHTAHPYDPPSLNTRIFITQHAPKADLIIIGNKGDRGPALASIVPWEHRNKIFVVWTAPLMPPIANIYQSLAATHFERRPDAAGVVAKCETWVTNI